VTMDQIVEPRAPGAAPAPLAAHPFQPPLPAAGLEIFLKLESLQDTGSFKSAGPPPPPAPGPDERDKASWPPAPATTPRGWRGLQKNWHPATIFMPDWPHRQDAGHALLRRRGHPARRQL